MAVCDSLCNSLRCALYRRAPSPKNDPAELLTQGFSLVATSDQRAPPFGNLRAFEKARPKLLFWIYEKGSRLPDLSESGFDVLGDCLIGSGFRMQDVAADHGFLLRHIVYKERLDLCVFLAAIRIHIIIHISGLKQ